MHYRAKCFIKDRLVSDTELNIQGFPASQEMDLGMRKEAVNMLYQQFPELLLEKEDVRIYLNGMTQNRVMLGQKLFETEKK